MEQNNFKKLLGVTLLKKVIDASDNEITREHSEIMKKIEATKKGSLERTVKDICYSGIMCARLGIDYNTASGYKKAFIFVYYQSINKQSEQGTQQTQRRSYFTSPQFAMD